MIENNNTNNFYTDKEMEERQRQIPKDQKKILEKLDRIKQYIQDETPYPHGNQSVDSLGDVSDQLEEIISSWEY